MDACVIIQYSRDPIQYEAYIALAYFYSWCLGQKLQEEKELQMSPFGKLLLYTNFQFPGIIFELKRAHFHLLRWCTQVPFIKKAHWKIKVIRQKLIFVRLSHCHLLVLAAL